MTPDLLRLTGEALYGPRWQSDLARDLGVADRTVRRWLAGADRPRPGVVADLRALVEARGAALRAVALRLRAEGPSPER